jgi:hypothetical protein
MLSASESWLDTGDNTRDSCVPLLQLDRQHNVALDLKYIDG